MWLRTASHDSETYVRVLDAPQRSLSAEPQPLTAFWPLGVCFKALPTLSLWGGGTSLECV